MKAAYYLFTRGKQIVCLYVGKAAPEWVRDIERLAKVKLIADTEKGLFFS